MVSYPKIIIGDVFDLEVNWTLVFEYDAEDVVYDVGEPCCAINYYLEPYKEVLNLKNDWFQQNASKFIRNINIKKQ